MVTMSRIVSPQTTPTVPSAILLSQLSLSPFSLTFLLSSSHSSPIQPLLLLPTSFSLSVVADLTCEVCLYAREFPLFVIFFFPLLPLPRARPVAV